MRLRLLVHPSLFGDVELTARREVLLLPDAISLVADLHHLLHSRLGLPTVVLRLSVDGFALLPMQRVDDVLRDDDVVEVQPASVSESPAKRRRIPAQPFMALKDVDHGVFATSNLVQLCDDSRIASHCAVSSRAEPALFDGWTPSHNKGARRSKPQSAMLALPLPLPEVDRKDTNTGARRSKPHSAMLALPLPLPEADCKDTNTGLAASRASSLKKVDSTGSTAHERSEPTSVHALDDGASAAVADDCNPALQNIQVPPQQFSGAWPDTTIEDLWMPLTREPTPWELIRFRSVGPSGLTELRPARVVGIELGKDGPTYVLICASGACERHFADRLLQASIPKPPASTDSAGSRLQSELQNHQAQVQTLQKHDESDPQNGRTCEEQMAGKGEEDSSDSESHSPQRQTKLVSALDAAASAPTPLRSMQNTRFAHKAACKMMDDSENVGQGLSPEEIREAVSQQVEFYFGADNYPRDSWLRSQADCEGWTSLRLIAKFNRMRQLTRDFDVVAECMRMSNIVEVQVAGRRRAY